MPVTEDLINFDIIETQKENIQSLPGGRSAKALASTLSPNTLHSPTPADTKNLNDAIRQEYELELKTIADSDDPLDIFDRYVKWTLGAYPSAQATPESQLRPLLERATKAFQSTPHYKSDPRYLKLWLHYIRLFSDSPRETFAYLARHSIGEGLALFYEEFAAWLEGAGRWKQAEEVYKLGIERGARPTERLARKFAEFQHRYESRAEDTNEPSSPALPTVRPALVNKVDPYATSTSRPTDPQAPRPPSGIVSSSNRSRSGKQKISIFSDADAPASDSQSSIGESAKGWDNIGTIAERKKENVMEARPWTGETLKGSKRQNPTAKMTIFKDESKTHTTDTNVNANMKFSEHNQVTNTRTGKIERVFVNLQVIYPTGEHNEMSFEELRAASRGWLNRDWKRERKAHQKTKPKEMSAVPLRGSRDSDQADLADRVSTNDNTKSIESSPGNQFESTVSLDLGRTTAFEIGKSSKGVKPKKTRIKEVKGETQTIKLNLSSPTGPKIRRKNSAEPTMTLHTKAATEDILDIFNQPLGSLDPLAGPPDSDGETDYDDDDYTSAGESTGTGRISGTSEFGDTQPDVQTGPVNSDTAAESISPWSDFTASKHVPKIDEDDFDNEDATNRTTGASSVDSAWELVNEGGISSQSERDAIAVLEDSNALERVKVNEDELVTPVQDEDDENQPPRTKYVPIPPEDYEPPVRAPRDPAFVAQNRLPFMTPIVEKTESSLGAFTAKSDKDYFNSKTPSRNVGNSFVTPEIDEELLSSPFQEIVNEARPARLPKLDILSGKGTSKDTPKESGPVVKDAQCNPVNETIRTSILNNSSRALSTFEGYHDYRPTSCNKTPEIRKYIKSLTKSKSDAKTTSLCIPPSIRFESDTSISYTVRRELGKGAFAPVYLAESDHDEKSDDEGCSKTSSALFAMKCEHPPSPWEFYIMSTVHDRLASSTEQLHASIIPSLCIPTALHLFADEAYLLETYHDQGTLLDLVNLAKSDPSGQTMTLDESIVMYFTVELLRTVEAMHSVGILHGDLKADNCLVRLGHSSPSSSTSDIAEIDQWSSQYSSEGANGWSHRGLCLIDFGRGIDLRAFRADVQFIADWKAAKQDCIEMREMRPWTYQVDYWGMAGVVHSLLFGRYMDDNVVAVSIDGSSSSTDTSLSSVLSPSEKPTSTSTSTKQPKKYRPREPLKRYWQTSLWTRLFDILLNPVLSASSPTPVSDGGTGEPRGIMPCTQSLKAVRTDMELWLAGEGGRRNGGLRAGLRRLEERRGAGR